MDQLQLGKKAVKQGKDSTKEAVKTEVSDLL